jgi:malic enzyme
VEPSFGGYNIEDVASPSRFELMSALEARLAVPAIRDDQYGTATVIAAALINACKVTDREPREQRVVINGAGVAGIATFDLLCGMGIGEIMVNDRAGIPGRRYDRSAGASRFYCCRFQPQEGAGRRR